jgi:N utilization substance protein A
MELKSLEPIILSIAEERGIPKEKVLESLEYAIAAAYKKDYGKKGQIIKAKIDPKKGEISFWQVKLVVDKKMVYFEKEEKESKDKIRFNPEKHILLEDAKKINPNIKVGEELIFPLEVKKDYGRIAAQTARQVILQKIKEVEKDTIYNEYKGKEGQVISGIVQRIEGKNVFLNIGKTIGILPKEEQVAGEFYRPGQRLKVYILKVESTSKGAVVVLSRAYPKLVSKLFEQEVPEISSGQVKIHSIAREPGLRTKIAVSATIKGLDPIGAMVGFKGTRVQMVINELGGEKIDIIEYSEDPKKYIANALSPAKVLEVEILPKNKALVTVPKDQLSLAIGKDGQNVRLAAKLTGWKIDVKPAQE